MFFRNRGARDHQGMPQAPLQACIPVSDGKAVVVVVGAWSDKPEDAARTAVETAEWLLGGKEAA